MLHIIDYVCLFRCNLPCALLAEWPGSFMYHCSNTGVEWTLNKSQYTKLTLEKNIFLLLLPGFKLATFWSWVRRFSNKLSWLAPAKSKMGWLCCCAGIVWRPIRNRADMQLIREHSATVISARWATVDWSWPMELNQCAQLNLHLKKKVQAGDDIIQHFPKILACKVKPPPSQIIWKQHPRWPSECNH